MKKNTLQYITQRCAFPESICLFLVALSIIVFLSPQYTYAQPGEYDIKAVFIGKIAQYIEWPADTGMIDANKPFVISVLGKNPFKTILEDMYLAEGR